MCPSESPWLEIEPLQRLRRHRAERAERVLQNALREQYNLGQQIEQARTEVEQACQFESRQRSALLARFRGQVMCPRALSGWGEDERKASARTARQEGVLQCLLEQQRLATSHVESARRHTAGCQRKVEKLREFLLLLAEEGPWPVHQQ